MQSTICIQPRAQNGLVSLRRAFARCWWMVYRVLTSVPGAAARQSPFHTVDTTPPQETTPGDNKKKGKLEAEMKGQVYHRGMSEFIPLGRHAFQTTQKKHPVSILKKYRQLPAPHIMEKNRGRVLPFRAGGPSQWTVC